MTDVQPVDYAELLQRAREAQEAAAALAQATRARRQAAQAARRADASRAELLRQSHTARLLARLETMPVIEQAKGILIAHSGCTPDAAFDMLRQASQRSNVPVREIAARIVASAAERSTAKDVIPPPGTAGPAERRGRGADLGQTPAHAE